MHLRKRRRWRSIDSYPAYCEGLHAAVRIVRLSANAGTVRYAPLPPMDSLQAWSPLPAMPALSASSGKGGVADGADNSGRLLAKLYDDADSNLVPEPGRAITYRLLGRRLDARRGEGCGQVAVGIKQVKSVEWRPALRPDLGVAASNQAGCCSVLVEELENACAKEHRTLIAGGIVQGQIAIPLCSGLEAGHDGAALADHVELGRLHDAWACLGVDLRWDEEPLGQERHDHPERHHARQGLPCVGGAARWRGS